MILGKLARQLVPMKLIPMGLRGITTIRVAETVSLRLRGSLEARAAARCPRLVFPSAGHGAAFWQDEGVHAAHLTET